MEEEENKNDASVLVRMPATLKSALLRQAAINKRRITAEINVRLMESLAKPPEPPKTVTTYQTTPVKPLLIDDRPPSCETRTDHDHAILSLFRQLPPEKQLSLLTLLKP